MAYKARCPFQRITCVTIAYLPIAVVFGWGLNPPPQPWAWQSNTLSTELPKQVQPSWWAAWCIAQNNHSLPMWIGLECTNFSQFSLWKRDLPEPMDCGVQTWHSYFPVPLCSLYLRSRKLGALVITCKIDRVHWHLGQLTPIISISTATNGSRSQPPKRLISRCGVY